MRQGSKEAPPGGNASLAAALSSVWPPYTHTNRFDGTFYPPGMETVPKRAAIIQANRYMVEHSDYLIAYVRHSVSNAWDLVEYARKYEKQGTITITALPRS